MNAGIYKHQRTDMFKKKTMKPSMMRISHFKTLIKKPSSAQNRKIRFKKNFKKFFKCVKTYTKLIKLNKKQVIYMLEQEEKDRIKKDIVENVNSILEKHGESFRMDKVNVLNTAESVKFMGNYRVYDRKKYHGIYREISNFLNKYGDVTINSKKIRDSGMKFTAVNFNFKIDD